MSEPKINRNAQTVMKVEQAAVAALNAITSRSLLKRMEEQSASVAESRTATSPPKSRIERKMKVSETEMCPLTRGILIVMREPMPMVMRERNKQRMSNSEMCSFSPENKKHTEPRAM